MPTPSPEGTRRHSSHEPHGRAPLAGFVLAGCLAARLCGQIQPGWTLSFPATTGHAMTYDSTRQRLVLFGGMDAFLQNVTWERDVSWTKAAVTGPSPRTGAALCFDTNRSVSVLFGGANAAGQPNNETWEWDGIEWIWRSASNVPARIGHAMAFDSARNRTVLFGGMGSTGELSDTWEWNGTAWSPISTPMPPARAFHGLAYDSARQRTVLFGGANLAGLLGDTWEWNGTTWILRSPYWPTPRRDVAMTYDGVRQRTVLFGGFTTNRINETWEWDGNAWAFRANTGPAPQDGARLAYDSRRQQAVLFGVPDPTSPTAAVWNWDGAVWTEDESLPRPSSRHDASMVYADHLASCVLCGGVNGLPGSTVARNDTWIWDGHRWQSAGATPFAAYGAMAYDTSRNRVVYYGYNGPTNSWTWEFTGTNWVQATSLPGPTSQANPAMVYDSANGVAVLFTTLGQTWTYNGIAWTSAATTGPSPRSRAAMAYDRSRLVAVLFGGATANNASLGDTWEWNGTAWNQKPGAGPSARKGACMVYDDRAAVCTLFGGSGLGYNETWNWNGVAWNLRNQVGFLGREGPAMAFDRLRGVAVAFGGLLQSADTDTTAEWRGDWTGTASPYGQGCGPSQFLLAADPANMPILSRTAQAQLTGIPSTTAFLAIGTSHHTWQGQALPLALTSQGMPGCSLLVSLEFGLQPLAVTAGAANFSLAIPNQSTLVGMDLHLQGLAIAPGANAAGAITSNGLVWGIGAR